MNIAMYQDCVSPHQMPLARELARHAEVDGFCYVYRDAKQQSRVDMGWGMTGEERWLCHMGSEKEESSRWIENVDCVIAGMRDVDLFERRARKKLKTFYVSERWFKPPIGILRLFHPRYFMMAVRLVTMLRSETSFTYLPIGAHAARDMARLCGLFGGDLLCLFRAPKLEFERNPGGKVWLVDEPRNTRSTQKYCLDKMRMWGYFVEGSKFRFKSSDLTYNSQLTTHNSLRVLWVGRLLKLKRVDTIIRAVGELSTRSTCATRLNITLDIYGQGPEGNRLKKIASKYGNVINFHPPVPIDEVRKLMCSHDVYVLSSNAYEGWGAVVSEALEEGMRVLGTYEAGSSVTMLPNECLFHAGDWNRLMWLLQNDVPYVGICDWSAKSAAKQILSFAGDL